jgi:hypothetical protein
MVGSDLTLAWGDHPVVLQDPDAASGLADLLHQYLEQTLASSPRKVAQARGISGELLFRALEDESVCVRLVFAPEKIEVSDLNGPPPAAPSLTADFLTVAHLASGKQSPLSLLADGKLSVRFSLLEIPFLLRVLRLLRIEREKPATWRWTALAALLVLALAMTLWLFALRR